MPTFLSMLKDSERERLGKRLWDQPDALPLLAFALRQLFDQARASGRMDATAYARLGGLKLGIEVEFRRACEDLGVTVSDPLVRELFVPHLATWDETAKATKRLPLSLEDLNRLCSHRPRLQKLADRLVEARLLEKTKAAVEVAHEALRREEPLASWIREALSDLLLRDQVFGEPREWAALRERDEALADSRGLARTAGRLEDAEALFGRPDFAHYSGLVTTYLLACRSKWNAELIQRLPAAAFNQTLNLAPPDAPREPLVDFEEFRRYVPAKLIGRQDQTDALSSAWVQTQEDEAGRPLVVAITGMGGAGKSSLVTKWAASLGDQGWPGCEAVVAWSFYSQGTRGFASVSADRFLKYALAFFRDPKMGGSSAKAAVKGERLAEVIGQQRTLLLLVPTNIIFCNYLTAGWRPIKECADHYQEDRAYTREAGMRLSKHHLSI